MMSAGMRLPEDVQTIPAALAFWAEQTPHAAAMVTPGSPAITYRALWDQATALAAALGQRGIGRRDRVVLLVPEGPALTAALLGTLSAAIAVPLSAELTPPELDGALEGLHAAAAIVTAPLSPASRECIRQHRISLVVTDAVDPSRLRPEGPFGANGERLTSPEPTDIAIVRQTSGTTGRPKRVARGHGEMVAFGRTQRDQFGLRQGDRVPVAAPMALTLGQTVLIHAVVAGATVICPPLADFARLWQTIADERPTWMSVSAGFLELLAQHLAESPAAPIPTSLRFVQVTAAAVSPALCEELAYRLGAPILPRYSSSEAGGVAMNFLPPARQKPGSVGRAIQEVQIVNAQGTRVSTGSAGEIWVRGPKVFSGYLDDPEATAAAFSADGWFRTGDVGYLDEEGFLYLTGRLNELINRGGTKIAPLEVDAALLAHPAVHAAAAFAVPHPTLGEDIVAAVVLARGQELSPRELRRWMLAGLSPPKVPRRIWFLDSLPTTSSGKVQRGVLAERFLARTTD